MPKIAVYTVLTGGYDHPRPINAKILPGADFFMITEEGNNVPAGWKKVAVKPDNDPHRQQRRLKLYPYDIPELSRYDVLIYMDANIEPIRTLQPLMQAFTGGVMTFAHPKRDCVYHEGWACIDLKKAPKDAVLKQLSSYAAEGIRPGSGMYQTGVIVRDRSDAAVRLCKEWVSELDKHTHRDQLSIIAARDRTGTVIKALPAPTFRQMFRVHAHREKRRPVIHYLTPYASDKNIGKAYNEEIERIGDDDDWIVVRDGDTLFPTPDWGRQVEDALESAGDKYALIGAMTNRIGGEHQRVPGMWDVWDIRDHVRKAMELEKAHWAVVEDTPLGVAGFFMAFRKRTWRQIRFTENANEARLFDTVFYKAVRSKKMKVGLMKGLYLIHLYRPLSDNARHDVRHLVPPNTNK